MISIDIIFLNKCKEVTLKKVKISKKKKRQLHYLGVLLTSVNTIYALSLIFNSSSVEFTREEKKRVYSFVISSLISFLAPNIGVS